MKGDVLRDIMLLLRELYDAHLKILLFSELGTRQFFSFETTTTQQRGNVIESLGQGKIRKILRSRCLNGVAKTKIVKMQNLSTLRLENIVTLSGQCFRVHTAELCNLHRSLVRISAAWGGGNQIRDP